MKLRDYMTNWDIIAQNSKQFHEHMANIYEVFDKNVELGKPEWDGKYFTVKFNIDDRIYEFKAMESEKGKFSILFYTFGPNMFDIKGSKKYVGDVFSGIRKALHVLINSRNVDMFWFNSSEQKLIRLYDVVIKRMKNEYKDFEYEGSKTESGVKFWIFKRRGYKNETKRLYA